MKSYLDALNYFQTYPAYNPADTSGWSLERVRHLAERLDSPHRAYPVLLIAGSKGKGSTAAMGEAILRAGGLKTGLYTSPYLHSFREQIRLGGTMISKELVVTLVNKLRPDFEATPGLTAFELTTVLALTAFAAEQVEVAVIEVGLGGRLDATNVVEPVVSVITPISYNHTQILGNTLTAITREKAGIIRREGAVVSAPQPPEVRATLEAVCRELGAHLTFTAPPPPDHFDLTGQSFTLEGERYTLPLLGAHQIVNAVTALAAVKVFGERATPSPSGRGAGGEGLAGVRWPGRLELLRERPYLVVDAAVNGASAERLRRALSDYFPGRRLTLIFGASSDHPIRDMLAVLLPAATGCIMTASRHPRAARPAGLVSLAAELGYAARSAPTAPLALEQALADANAEDLICVAGSLFLAADIREAWLRREGLPLPPLDPRQW